MGTMEFGYNEYANREYLPKYGEIDWHQLWLDKQGGEDVPSVWGETVDEFGQFCEQLHQENCAFYMNETNSSFDVLIVLDPRDDNANFWWSRHQMGDEQFEDLFERIGDEVSVIFTRYPHKDIAEFVLKIMQTDLDTTWTYGEE